MSFPPFHDSFGRVGTPTTYLVRRQLLKAAVAGFIVLTLLFAGQKGRQRAEVLRRLNEVTLECDRLEQVTDAPPLSAPWLSGAGTGESASSSTSPGMQILPQISKLKTDLDQFLADYNPGQYSRSEALE